MFCSLFVFLHSEHLRQTSLSLLTTTLILFQTRSVFQLMLQTNNIFKCVSWNKFYYPFNNKSILFSCCKTLSLPYFGDLVHNMNNYCKNCQTKEITIIVIKRFSLNSAFSCVLSNCLPLSTARCLFWRTIIDLNKKSLEKHKKYISDIKWPTVFCNNICP